MFHLFINPSCERVWRLVLEDAKGKQSEAVIIRALTFMDAIHDWWENGLLGELLPHDVEIELGNSLGGVLTFYIADGNCCDVLMIWDVTSEYDTDSISCAELVERRKQERAARKARKA